MASPPTVPKRARGTLRVWLLAALAALAVALVAPAAASAHATLIDSNPADQQVVPSAPSRVTLSFSEPVETSLGAVRVFDANAKRVDTGDPFRIRGDEVGVKLASGLPNGTYTVSWSVLSADGHPIDGAFVFHIGAPGANPAGVASQVGGRSSTLVKRAADVVRFFDIALVVLLVGEIAALLLIFRDADRDVERRLWHVVAGVGFGLSIAAGATIVLEAAIVTGVGVGGATKGGVLSAVLSTRFGHMRLAQVIGAEVIAIAAVWAATARGKALKWTIGVLAVALAVTPGLSGHAGQNGTPAVIADAGHVLSASMWVGGLAAVTLGLLLAGDRRVALGRVVFPRFSTAALISVGVLLLSGTIGAFQNVDSPGQLTSTAYGRLLLAKIAIALVLIGLGAVSRTAVRRLRANDDGDAPRRLRNSVMIELGLMLTVLAVTSVFVAKPPAKAVANVSAARSATTAIGDLQARLVIDPGRTGSNLVHVYLSKGGTPVTVDEVTVNARPATGDQGPFRLILRQADKGHYIAPPLQATVPGIWTFDVAVRRGDFDLKDATVRLPIRAASR